MLFPWCEVIEGEGKDNRSIIWKEDASCLYAGDTREMVEVYHLSSIKVVDVCALKMKCLVIRKKISRCHFEYLF